MNDITGNILVFSDQHFGIKNNSQLRQRICVSAIKQMIQFAVQNDVKTVLFCGDFFHQRNQLSIDTIDIAHRCMQALAKKCRVVMILGNHDLFNKNTVDVNSINMFQDIKNVEIVYKPEQILMNGKNILLVPWLSDLSAFKNSSFDFMFGHFDISSKYLIKSYVEDNSSDMKTKGVLLSAIDNDLEFKENSSEASCLVGDFVELAKNNGTIFAGHIHTHKEFRSKGRKFIFIGSPYQQTLGDIGNECGFYFIDASNSYRFVQISNIPKHVQIIASDVLKAGLDKYDFSIVKNNIIQKVYDVDVSSGDDAKITQKINDFAPYEELLPEYNVKIDFSSSGEKQNSIVDNIQKSKLDYMKAYIDGIDEKALNESKIDKDTLFNLMKRYYEAVVGE